MHVSSGLFSILRTCSGQDRKALLPRRAIALAAVKLGIEVYRPIHEGGRYDLIFGVDDRLVRVQCKWATRSGDVVVVRCYSARRAPEGMRVRTYTAREVDMIVAYCSDVDSCFVLEPEHFVGRRLVHLRLAPTRNNQRRGINWANDFALESLRFTSPGAIAQLGERLAGSQKVAGSSPAGSTITSQYWPR